MPYTTEAQIRQRYPFLSWTQDYHGEIGSILEFNAHVFAVTSATKNGAAIVGGGTDYTFVFPKTINLVVPAAATDVFNFEGDIGISSADVTAQITQAESFINAKLNASYDEVPFADPAPPLILEISTNLVGCYAMNQMSFETMDGKVWFDRTKEFKMHLDHMLEEIRAGNLDLLNTAGTIITDTGAFKVSVSGGDAVFDLTGSITDLDWFDFFETDNREDRGETAESFDPRIR